MKGFPRKVRDQAAHRSGLVCEGCGGGGPLELHHRKYRSRLGADTVENALSLCGWGNTLGCHAIAHGGRHAEESGWSIRSGGDPLMIPMRDSQGFWWLLRADGSKTCIPAQLADEYRLLAGLLPVVID